jgi:5-methyltetrahydrofolate--homocysteine methyltransferase
LISAAAAEPATVPEALEAGVAIVGSCCGSTPEHTRAIREMVNAFGRQVSV